MGLMFRRRRPIARVAAGAATAGIAYHMGKRSQQPDQDNEQAAAAYQATQPAPSYAASPPQYVPPPPASAPSEDPVEQLTALAKLHDAGQLTDQEFTAAKAKLLGT